MIWSIRVFDRLRLTWQQDSVNFARLLRGRFPSGQRDQTVNLTRKLRWFESSPPHHSLALRYHNEGDGLLLMSSIEHFVGCGYSLVVEP